ncbi:MAG: hypothetical protein KIT11_04555 [Fimbriimonadaceae bacterium]|nr:hypothetical protein [Fimbriimonadaceae bacterium]QYK56835.1 MAG: hypothetical protein KF733_04970 [Fimbriimonadaceae bacterium]
MSEVKRRISLAEPVTQLKSIKIVDNGEPLVDYTTLSPRIRVSRPRFLYKRVTYLRQSVAEMLFRAAEALPPGYSLSVIEGWRPPYIQRRMYLSTWARFKARNPEWSDAQLRRVVNQFTAPIHGRVPPPHSTGAALDVVLSDKDGNEYDHSKPYELHDARSFAFEAPELSAESREYRTILAGALRAGGLTNYPSEWWHWSYGDQGWAYRTGAPHAIYGPTEPPDWAGAPEDMHDGPLVWAEA